MAQRASNITKLAEFITSKTGVRCSKQNLSNKLRKGTIRYDEMLLIAEILGFEIKFEDVKSAKKP